MQYSAFLAEMVRNDVYNAFLNNLTMATTSLRVPPQNDPCREPAALTAQSVKGV